MSHQGGAAAIAGWLAARDISGFDPHGTVPKSGAWREVQQSWESADDEVTVALEALGHPDVLLGTELLEVVFDGVDELRKAMRSKAFIFRMMKAGYVTIPRAEGVSHWRGEANGHGVKSANAYVRESLGWDVEKQREAAKQRVADRVASGAVPLTAKRKTQQPATEGF